MSELIGLTLVVTRYESQNHAPAEAKASPSAMTSRENGLALRFGSAPSAWTIVFRNSPPAVTHSAISSSSRVKSSLKIGSTTG